MALFKKIFGKDRIDAISAFEEADRINARELSYMGQFHNNAEPELNAAFTSLAADPFNKDVAEKIINIYTKSEAEKFARSRVIGVIGPVINDRAIARTRPAAVAVFSAVLSRLEEELEKVSKADAHRADRYGAPLKPSAEAEALSSEIERVKTYILHVTKGSPRLDDIRVWIKSVIGDK